MFSGGSSPMGSFAGSTAGVGFAGAGTTMVAGSVAPARMIVGGTTTGGSSISGVPRDIIGGAGTGAGGAGGIIGIPGIGAIGIPGIGAIGIGAIGIGSGAFGSGAFGSGFGEVSTFVVSGRFNEFDDGPIFAPGPSVLKGGGGVPSSLASIAISTVAPTSARNEIASNPV